MLRTEASPSASPARPAARAREIAVLLPCYNEAAAIASVVESFRAALPGCTVYVYDNNSTDDTAARAEAAGAEVRNESMQGKGNVVRRMFADIDADIYVMADGDGTYDANSAAAMIESLVDANLDMVVGARLSANEDGSFRPGHRFGNIFLTTMVGYLFGRRLSDVLSGYRVFSRRFVKSFPALASGFEIETELTIHALELKMPVTEYSTPYANRIKGSSSKLNTIRDGLRILATVAFLFKEVRPFKFFGALFAALAFVAFVMAWPLFFTYFDTGLVPRYPTAVLAMGIMLLAFISLISGIILDTVSRGRREAKRMNYLALPAVRPR